MKPGNKALFLDRDGVINVEHGYVHRRDHFEFQDGIFELCRSAQAMGYLLVVVTNQAGIARGYYTEAQFEELTAWMVDQFSQRGVEISRVYYCPYHPTHGVGQYKQDSPDRKPKPGMLLKARKDLDLNLEASVLVGDQMSDIGAAKAAGVGTAILLDPAGAGAHGEGDYQVAETLEEVRGRFFSASSPRWPSAADASDIRTRGLTSC